MTTTAFIHHPDHGQHTPVDGPVDPVLSGVDWAAISLPPTTFTVQDGIHAGDGRHADARHAAITRAYYAPQAIRRDPTRPDRERRVAGGQVVVVTADGTVVATWRDGTDEYGTAGGAVEHPVPAPSASAVVPADHGELVAMLAESGHPAREHRWGRHWGVSTPAGVEVYLPADPGEGDDAAADADLLARLGCLSCYNAVV